MSAAASSTLFIAATSGQETFRNLQDDVLRARPDGVEIAPLRIEER
ncbi:hypothetical protein [Micromonospora sp. NPDC023633]